MAGRAKASGWMDGWMAGCLIERIPWDEQADLALLSIDLTLHDTARIRLDHGHFLFIYFGFSYISGPVGDLFFVSPFAFVRSTPRTAYHSHVVIGREGGTYHYHLLDGFVQANKQACMHLWVLLAWHLVYLLHTQTYAGSVRKGGRGEAREDEMRQNETR